MKRSVILLTMLLAIAVTASAQKPTPDIHALVAKVNAGSADEVREQLPTLISEHPNDPGVLYLQALLTREGADAVRTYQSIIDNFPKSEWADDALFKVYQFYYALGLYRTADIKMNQLKAMYPESPYASQQSPTQTEAPEPAQSAPKADAPAQEPAKPVIVPPTDQTPAAEPKSEPAPQEKPVQQTDTAIPVRFSLQVGAFTVHANALTEKAKYEKLGYTAEMISKVRDTKSLFIVMVGSYGTYDEAKAAAAELKRKTGVSAMAVSR